MDSERKCGNCKWWKRDDMFRTILTGKCKCPLPDSCESSARFMMKETNGRNCPCFAPRQETEEAK